MHCHHSAALRLHQLAFALTLALPLVLDAQAADTTVQPAAGSGFVVKDSSGANERLRVQDSGAVTLPAVPGAATQAQALCISAGGLLGPCAASSGGTSYTAATGLTLTGTTFAIAPTFQLPQGCAANQIAQWNGVGWGCVAAPSGGTAFTLPYAATQADAGALFSIANSGTGKAANFEIVNAASANKAISVVTAGTGPAAGFIASNTANDAPLLQASHAGTGTAVSVYAIGGTGVYANSYRGKAGMFEIDNSANTDYALLVQTAGLGSAARIINSSAANAVPALHVSTVGSSTGISTFSKTVAALYAGSEIGIGVWAKSDKGSAGKFEITNALSNALALDVRNAGGSSAGFFENSNTNSPSPAVSAINQGDAEAIYARSTGGSAGVFAISNAANSHPSVLATTAGTGGAGYFVIDNSASAFAAVAGNTDGSGPGVYGYSAKGYGVWGHSSDNHVGVYGSSSSGIGGLFQLTGGNTGAAIRAFVSSPTSTADIAWFQHTGNMVARIDINGKGYFNGGTASSGADVAEYVPTSGTTPQPGDVVEFDSALEDHYRISTIANNPRVAGVISTEPGVTLNDKTGATKATSGPALALAGRVPVKATNENGPIGIGDLLVASSMPGHAMRAPLDPAPGTVIGKAAQKLDSARGSITMLVWPH